MNIKIIAIAFVFLMGLQMLIVAILTHLNRDFLNKYKATNYSKAMSNLAIEKPKTVFIIRCCYAACLIEVAILGLLKLSGRWNRQTSLVFPEVVTCISASIDSIISFWTVSKTVTIFGGTKEAFHSQLWIVCYLLFHTGQLANLLGKHGPAATPINLKSFNLGG